MSYQEFIPANRQNTEEISDRIMQFQILYIKDGAERDCRCDLKNLSLDNVDFTRLCKNATLRAADTLCDTGHAKYVEFAEESLDRLANHFDFTDSTGYRTIFQKLDFTHSVMRNTYFVEPDFRHSSQFFTVDVTGAHWVQPKFTLGTQLCGLSILHMNKLQEPEFYDYENRLIKGAYVDNDGIVKYNNSIKNVWDNARRGVDVYGAFQDYNTLRSLSEHTNKLTDLRNSIIEQAGRLLP